MKKISLLLVACLLSSCQAVLMGAFGLKQPQVQLDAAVKKYAAIHYPGKPIYRVDSAQMNTLFHEVYKPKWEAGFRPIQFICFAPTGKIVVQWASCEGNLAEILSTYPPRSKYPSDSAKTFAYFTKGVRPFENGSKAITLNQKGYTYLVYWAVFTNKQAVNMVQHLNDYVAKNGGSPDDIILVNTDVYSADSLD